MILRAVSGSCSLCWPCRALLALCVASSGLWARPTRGCTPGPALGTPGLHPGPCPRHPGLHPGPCPQTPGQGRTGPRAGAAPLPPAAGWWLRPALPWAPPGWQHRCESRSEGLGLGRAERADTV